MCASACASSTQMLTMNGKSYRIQIQDCCCTTYMADAINASRTSNVKWILYEYERYEVVDVIEVDRSALHEYCVCSALHLYVDEYGNRKRPLFALDLKPFKSIFGTHFFGFTILSFSLPHASRIPSLFCCHTVHYSVHTAQLDANSFLTASSASTVDSSTQIRWKDRQIQNLLRNFFFIATLRKNLHLFYVQKKKKKNKKTRTKWVDMDEMYSYTR